MSDLDAVVEERTLVARAVESVGVTGVVGGEECFIGMLLAVDDQALPVGTFVHSQLSLDICVRDPRFAIFDPHSNWLARSMLVSVLGIALYYGVILGGRHYAYSF